ncbi:MAG: ATP-binding protein [Methylovulum sp.]|nr:ATP-binding protein [Methylovulum sp.]
MIKFRRTPAAKKSAKPPATRPQLAPSPLRDHKAQRAATSRRTRNSIRWQLLTTMIGLIVGLVVTLTAIELVLQKRSLENELSKRIDLMKANLIEHGAAVSNVMLTQVENDVAAFNFSHITENLHNTIKESPLLAYGILMNNDGVAFIHTSHPELQQETLQDEASRYALAQRHLAHIEYLALNVTEFILPIHFGNKQWGVLRLGFTMQELDKEIARSQADIANKTRDLIITTALIALLFVLIGSVIVMLISTTLSRPLMRLTESVKELARGNFELATQLLDETPNGQKVRFKAQGEIGQLAYSFIEMANEIRQSQDKLADYNRTLEAKVKERTQELERANEKLKGLDQMKTNFLSTVSHELRTPLTSVMGFARILQKKFESTLFPPLSQSEDKKVQKAMRQVMDNAQIIVEEGERLTTLINDVLDLAKMEAGRVDWNMRELNIEDIIDRAIAATSALVANKPVQLCKIIEEALPLCEGDRDRLIQVVINLISNAVKFTDRGKVTCRAQLKGGELVVSVTDSGCGIKPEDQPLVFEKFKQVGDTLTDKPKGTGLGLPICKEIIEHHGGHLWLESELDVGSTFLFSLPLPQQHHPDATLMTQDGEAISLVWQSNREALADALQTGLKPVTEAAQAHNILIIDDDVNIREFLQQELSAENYAVREAGSGSEGLAMIAGQQPDLILLDVKMPHLNGFAVAARLHTNPATLHIPIILHTIAEDKLLAEQLGIDYYLTKPAKDMDLLAAVRQVLVTAPPHKKILIFSDGDTQHDSWALGLHDYGYQVSIAAAVEEGLALAANLQPQLVVADAALAIEHQLIKRLRVDLGLDKTFFTLLDNPHES